MNIIVTGCSSGIGEELVRNFCKNNHKVIGIARTESKLKALEIELGTRNFLGISIDITNFQIIDNKVVKKVLNFFPTVHILINNAGYLTRNSFEDISSVEYQKMFLTNVYAPANLIKVLLPAFNKEKSHIVNIASMGGFQGSSKFPGLSWYSASKAAIACLSECLAVEFKDRNIAVNCLCPGAVQTEMLAKAFPGYQAPITPVEMAEFIANFALTGHKVFNGKVIPVTLSNP